MLTVVKKGDVFYADLSPAIGAEQGGIRPVVIIQNDVGNKYSSTVVVASITSQIMRAKLPTHVELPSDVCGLNNDSVILLEQIRTADKRRLKEKIGRVNDEILARIDYALSMELNIETPVVPHEVKELKEYVSHFTKPLVITEGKTDVQLIETAWRKLHPKEKMFFECEASGIEFDKKNRVGNADNVRRTIEYLSTIVERSVIGLFDNDREGNNQFSGLNKKIFEKYDIKKDIRKHINKDVWGMLLPVPVEREYFVTNDDMEQRYFVIEHYFSDDILKKHGMYGPNILGTSVFKVNNRKDSFSKEIEDLKPEEFKNFDMLFSKLRKIFNTKSNT